MLIPTPGNTRVGSVNRATIEAPHATHTAPARGLYPSTHARQKMADRHVTWSEVVEAVERPEITEPHNGNRRYSRAGLCVVVAVNGCVITILLRRTEQWTDEDARTRTQESSTR